MPGLNRLENRKPMIRSNTSWLLLRDKYFILLGQTFCLWVIYYLSTLVVKSFHIPLPGSVLGMIILFVLLSAGIIKEKWLTAATTPLLKHLAFFFIPIAVELMQWGDLFQRIGYLLFLPLVVSLLVALVTTGGIVQLLITSRCEDEMS